MPVIRDRSSRLSGNHCRDNVPEPGIPESFKVLIQEMRSLCLNVEALDSAGEAIDLQDDEEDQFQTPEPVAMPTGLEDLTSGAEF